MKNIAFSNPLYSPRYSMITTVPMDLSSWDLKESSDKALREARQDAGIGAIDCISFRDFICGAVVNGIRCLELYQHPLATEDGWTKFREENPAISSPSFEDALARTAISLSEYRQDCDAFELHRGEEVLTEALETFLAVFPHLKQPGERNAAGAVSGRGNDYLDVEENGTIPESHHYRSRVFFAVSYSDTIELDDHLAGVFSLGFKILAKSTHGFPARFSEEEWSTILGKLADAFYAYHIFQTPLSDEVKNLFVTHFPDFWD